MMIKNNLRNFGMYLFFILIYIALVFALEIIIHNESSLVHSLSELLMITACFLYGRRIGSFEDNIGALLVCMVDVVYILSSGYVNIILIMPILFYTAELVGMQISTVAKGK